MCGRWDAKEKLLTAYDYGSGRVWQYIYANSPQEILRKYPGLTVFIEEPSWFKDRILSKITVREYDILKSFMGEPGS